jgi:hypothetical protein
VTPHIIRATVGDREVAIHVNDRGWLQRVPGVALPPCRWIDGAGLACLAEGAVVVDHGWLMCEKHRNMSIWKCRRNFSDHLFRRALQRGMASQAEILKRAEARFKQEFYELEMENRRNEAKS